MNKFEKVAFYGGIAFLILGLLIAWSAITIKTYQWSLDHRIVVIPWCQEDEVVYGVGDYRGDVGMWEEYRCIAGDDYRPYHLR